MKVAAEMVVLRTPDMRGADRFGYLVVMATGDLLNGSVSKVELHNPLTGEQLAGSARELHIAQRLLYARGLGSCEVPPEAPRAFKIGRVQ